MIKQRKLTPSFCAAITQQSLTAGYSVGQEASNALLSLYHFFVTQLPAQFLHYMQDAVFEDTSTTETDLCLPCPLRQQEAYIQKESRRSVEMKLDRVACFLISAYITNLDGLDKCDPKIYIDLNQDHAQSTLYQSVLAGIYQMRKQGECYRPTNSRKCINTIEGAVKKFSSVRFEKLKIKSLRAGCSVLMQEKFLQTPHDQVIASLFSLTIQFTNESTPPAPCTDYDNAGDPESHVATAPNYFTSLQPRYSADRAVFESLLRTADVNLDGYRPGVLGKLGYSPEALATKAAQRGRGVVYVGENCFGGPGFSGTNGADRLGWQQIADCITGVAWEQGKFKGLDEPVVLPFLVLEYGTGCPGRIAAMTELYRRANYGGSWICRISLSQCYLFLLSDSVDEVSARAPKKHTAARIQGLHIGYVRSSRPNGLDTTVWEDWERDESLLTTGEKMGTMN
ncbi:CoA-transferase family III [Xylariaceae sp. FL0016]|nr:CoA-transferase family III [Xylariaceae sp. FL0016]